MYQLLSSVLCKDGTQQSQSMFLYCWKQVKTDTSCYCWTEVKSPEALHFWIHPYVTGLELALKLLGVYTHLIRNWLTAGRNQCNSVQKQCLACTNFTSMGSKSKQRRRARSVWEASLTDADKAVIREMKGPVRVYQTWQKGRKSHIKKALTNTG